MTYKGYIALLDKLFAERIMYPSSVIVVPERNLAEIREYASPGELELRAEMSKIQNRASIGLFFRDVPLLLSKHLLNARPRLLNLKDAKAYDMPYFGLGPDEFDYLLALRLAALCDSRLHRFERERKRGVISVEIVKTYAVFEQASFTEYSLEDAYRRAVAVAFTQQQQSFKRQKMRSALSFSSPLAMQSISTHDEITYFLHILSEKLLSDMDKGLAKETGIATSFANRFIGRLYELYRRHESINSDELLFLIPERYRQAIAQDETAKRWTGAFFVKQLFESRVDEIVLIQRDDYVKLYKEQESDEQ